MLDRGIYCASVSKIVRLDFLIVPTVWYCLFWFYISCFITCRYWYCYNNHRVLPELLLQRYFSMGLLLLFQFIYQWASVGKVWSWMEQTLRRVSRFQKSWLQSNVESKSFNMSEHNRIKVRSCYRVLGVSQTDCFCHLKLLFFLWLLHFFLLTFEINFFYSKRMLIYKRKTEKSVFTHQ